MTRELDEKALEAALLAMSEVDKSSRGELEARMCLRTAMSAYLTALPDEPAERGPIKLHIEAVHRIHAEIHRRAIVACIAEIEECSKDYTSITWGDVIQRVRAIPYDGVSDEKTDAHRPSGGWRPIESAPKDGTVFLALSPKGISACRWDMVDWGDHPMDRTSYWWTDPYELVFFEDGPNDAPTRWQPLDPPSPPKDED
ncbi:MAG: hypothetical protein AAGK02_07210 [Pseudomonadota bacterium]